MMNLVSISFLLVVLLISGTTYAKSQDPESTETIDSSKEMIVKLACRYLGLEVDSLNIKSENIVTTKVTENALSYNLANTDKKGLVIWEVLLKDVRFKYEGRSSIRDYYVYIDSSTGNLLEIHSMSDKYGNQDTINKPTNKRLIDALQRKQIRVMDSAIECRLSLYDAMQNSQRWPDRVHEIIAYYLCGTSTFNQSVRPIWYIILRGFDPPYEFNNRSNTDTQNMSVNTRNSMIQGIDGVTGEKLFYMSLPFEHK